MALALGLIASCTTTADPIGYNAGPGVPLRPLTGPPTPYPTPFHDRGHIDAEITAKIAGAFAQLFHGTGPDQPIYYSDGIDGAGNPSPTFRTSFTSTRAPKGSGSAC